MKSVRPGIGRLHIDLADYAIMAKLLSSHEQIGVQFSPMTMAPVLLSDYDAVDVQKPVVAALKPLEVDAVVVVRLLKR
jgi:hypothetical protein